MARDGTLTRSAIVDAGVELVAREGWPAVTFRRLGAVLNVDPTAIYRHVADKVDLTAAISDRLLHAIVVDVAIGRRGWRAIVRDACLRLRAAHLAAPELAAEFRARPPLQEQEHRLTELLLTQLRRGGLAAPDAARAYHALIELTVGSAVLDASLAQREAGEREAEYDRWRTAYAMLDEAVYPTTTAMAERLYRGSADDRFAVALDWLLDGISVRCRVDGA